MAGNLVASTSAGDAILADIANGLDLVDQCEEDGPGRLDMLPGYLNEFMWRERAGADKFNAILNEIVLQYPVNR